MGNRLARLELSLGGAPGFWFPERCFWFPWCFFPGMVFSVPGRVWWFPGCFQFPGWGVFSSQIRAWCSRNGVLGARRCFQFPGWCSRFPARGTAWRCLWFPYGVSGSRACSSPSSLLLLASLLSFASLLPSFLPSTFPHFLRFCLASSLFLSCPPFLPSPFLPCLLLPFL